MKKLLLVLLLSSYGFASMCDIYFDKSKENNEKFQRAFKHKLYSEYARLQRDSIYYAEKLIINCKEETPQYKLGVDLLKILKPKAN